VATRLLEHWDAEQREFVKVMPRDYRRILEATGAEMGALIGNAVTAPRYHGRCARWGWNSYGHRVCRAWY